MAVATHMNETVTGGQIPEKMVGALDYRTYDPKRTFSRFYRVSKWWNAQMPYKYLEVDTAGNTYPKVLNCSTCVNLQCSTSF
jgi:hypothetical protein